MHRVACAATTIGIRRAAAAPRKNEPDAPKLTGIGQGSATEAEDARGAGMRSSRMSAVCKGSSSGAQGSNFGSTKCERLDGEIPQVMARIGWTRRLAGRRGNRFWATFLCVRAPFLDADVPAWRLLVS